MPLPSSAQLIESKVKDVVFCGSEGCDEDNISKFSMMCSVMLPDTTAAVKNNASFQNRKWWNDEARDCMHILVHNA